MIQRFAAQDPMDEIRKAFELFDEDKRGKISFRSFVGLWDAFKSS